VAHAVSLSYARSDHMSPVAVAMTSALHVAVAVALYWISPLRYVDTTPDAIAITMERELPQPPAETPQPPPTPEPPTQAAAPPPPAPAPPAAPAPTPPMRLGLAPIAPNPDPKAATPGVEQPAPPKLETPAAEAARPDPPKVEQQQALATPPPPPPPPPPARTLESELPPLDVPPPPVTSQEIPRPPAPPPPAPKAPPPTQQRVQPAPPPQRPAQQPALQSSPLANVPQTRTPAEQRASRQAPTLVNPADAHGQRRVEDQYLWYVAQKLSQHQQFVRNATAEAGNLVLRITIARDGRLVDVGLSRSSGAPTLDNFALNMVRQVAPYMPLPDDISGPQHTFVLPLNFKRN
jgi:TonB family protein